MLTANDPPTALLKLFVPPPELLDEKFRRGESLDEASRALFL
jgi:hypothetical protein